MPDDEADAAAVVSSADRNLDEELAEFVPPPRPECPVCMIPLPLDLERITLMTCCGTYLCLGCIHGTDRANIEKALTRGADITTLRATCKRLCPYCREACTSDPKENMNRLEKLLKRNPDDPFPLHCIANFYYKGTGVEKDEKKAWSLMLRAADLGCADAALAVGNFYHNGLVVEQDSKEAKNYYEKAAKAGKVQALHHFASMEIEDGNIEVGVYLLRLAASAGDKHSLEALMKAYKNGQYNSFDSKEALAETLRAFQSAEEEMRSDARDGAAKFAKITDFFKNIKLE